MNYCSDKIEELLKRKKRKDENCAEKENSAGTCSDLDGPGENNVKNETGEGSDSDNTINKMVRNTMEIVKLSNQLSELSFDEYVLESQKNCKKKKDVEQQLLEAVMNISLYSSSETTKEFFECSNGNSCPDLKNNFPFIASVLEDTFTRANQCFRYFGCEFQKKSFNECFSQRCSEDNREETEGESKENKTREINLLENSVKGDIISMKESGNNETKKKTYDIVNNNNTINDKENESNNQKSLCDINTKSHDCLSKNIPVAANSICHEPIDFSINKDDTLSEHVQKKNDDIGNIKKTLQKKNHKYILINYLNKIQNSWLHLTNNYACFFVPRLRVKHNSLIDLDERLKKAITIQDKYIAIKSRLMKMVELYKDGYMFTTMEITKKSKPFFEENKIQNDKKDLVILPEEEYHSDCSDNSGYSIDMEEEKIADECFFVNFFEKVNKDMNKYKYVFTDLQHPYEYEINYIVQMYENETGDVHKYMSLHKIEKVVHDLDKQFILVDTKEKLMECINYIKSNCDTISLNFKLNLKKSYLGFIALLYIGTKQIDYIIDTFPIFEALSELNEITTNSHILKITYDAKTMIKYLQKDFSIYLVNMVDLSIFARYLNVPNNSIHFLIFNYFHININENYQNKSLDFVTRPLTYQVLNGIRAECYYLLHLLEYLKTDLYFNYVYCWADKGFIPPNKRCSIDEKKKEKEEQKEIKEVEKTICEVSEETSPSPLMLKKSNNVYVNFQKMDYFDVKKDEMEKVHDIIKTVFIESNKLCLEKYNVLKIHSIKETKKQIKNILQGFYTSTDYDTLIENLLIWRKKLSKKIDEAPDNILNIHNIISIVLNFPTSISALKNNIVPLSDVVMDNIEQLFNVISKSNLQKKSSRFYEQILKREGTCNEKNKSNTHIHFNISTQVKGEIPYEGDSILDSVDKSDKQVDQIKKKKHEETENSRLVSDISGFRKCTDFILSSNLYKKHLMLKETNDDRSTTNKIENMENIGPISEVEGPDEKMKDAVYELEKTIFLNSDQDSSSMGQSYKKSSKKTKMSVNASTNDISLNTSNSFVRHLNKLNKTVKKKKKETENRNKNKINFHCNLQKANILTIKTIDKNKTKVSQQEKQKKKMKCISYKKQYGLRNVKQGLTKNILSEIK